MTHAGYGQHGYFTVMQSFASRTAPTPHDELKKTVAF